MAAMPTLPQEAQEEAPWLETQVRSIRGAAKETKSFTAQLLGLRGPSRDRNDARRFKKPRRPTTEGKNAGDGSKLLGADGTSVIDSNPPKNESFIERKELSTNNSHTERRWSGCIEFQGRVFAAPCSDPSILIIDPTTMATGESINLKIENISLKWYGLATLNDKIYCAPHNFKGALIIDPLASLRSEQFTYIHLKGQGSDGSARFRDGEVAVRRRWAGISACGGKLFCAPFDDNDVLVIEPTEGREANITYTPTKKSGPQKWQGIAALDGYLYACPCRETSMLVINASSRDLNYIPVCSNRESAIKAEKKWSAIVAHAGKLYCCPHECKRVLVVEPSAGTRHQVTYIDVYRDESYQDIVSDGTRLFCAPYNGTNVLVIDPQKSGSARVSFIDIGGGFCKKRFASLCVVDSHIFLVPFNDKSIVKLPVPHNTPAGSIESGDISTIEALNDSAMGTDRLGYRFYAKAIVDVLKTSSPPICVGLYAQWGQGKSFMMNCLKQQFDPTARADDSGLKQYFEEGYDSIPDSGAHGFKDFNNDETESKSSDNQSNSVDESDDMPRNKMWRHRVYMLALFIGWREDRSKFKGGKENNLEALGSYSRLKNNILESSPYWFIILIHILEGTLKDARYWMLEFWQGSAPSLLDEEVSLIGDLEASTCQRNEYCFVDFNAWLFAGGEGEIWAGLIRELWQKVELRISKENPKGRLNFKTVWRVGRAEEELIAVYGSKRRVRLLAICGIIVPFIIVCLIASEVGGYTSFFSGLAFTIESIAKFSILVALFGPVGFRSSMMLALAAFEGEQSRGDAIYEEATQISSHGSLGFMEHVRLELQKLFEFMLNFQEETGTSLKLVLFIDDLDRCLDGKSVRVLEALTLLLSPSSSPVTCFLAVDPRIVVGAINKAFESCLDISKARISGQEYLEKLVQIPFSLPAPSKGSVERFIRINLGSKKMTSSELAARIRKRIFPKVKDWIDGVYPLRAELVFPAKVLARHLDDIALQLLNKEGRIGHVRICADTFLSLSSIESDADLIYAVSNCITEAGADGIFGHWLKYIDQSKKGDIEAAEEHYTQLEMTLSAMTLRESNNWKVATSKVRRGIDIGSILSTNTNSRERNQDVAVLGKESAGDARKSIGSNGSLENRHVEEILTNTTIERGSLTLNNIEVFESSKNLLPESLIRVFARVAPLLDANPRRIKRILNVYQVIYGVAKSMPLRGDFHFKIADDARWPHFATKLIKWVSLCEMYPYRMSYLVQFIMDHTQKVEVNRIIDSASGYEHVGSSSSSSGLFKYFEMVDSGPPREAASLRGDDHIAKIFAEHVERFLYYDGSQTLSVLDSDPERFWALMSLPFSSMPSEGIDEIHISVQDILGPEMHDHSTSNSSSLVHYDSSFSLLHYSFNLNPTLRQQIAIDLHELVSSCELKNVKRLNGIDTFVDSLPQGGVTLKSKLLTEYPLPFHAHEDRPAIESPLPTSSGKKKITPLRNPERFTRSLSRSESSNSVLS